MAIVIHSLEDALRVGGILAKSGYFRDAKSEAQAIAKILAGHELGFGAVASLQNVHLVDGKLTLSASMMAALVKRSGKYNYKVLQSSDTNCTIEFYEKWDGSWEAIGRASFTLDEARKAGLLTKHNWSKYPTDMLFARAMSRGCRQFCPDVFMGSVYV